MSINIVEIGDGVIKIEGNYLDCYDEENDTFESQYIQIENGELLEIDEKSMVWQQANLNIEMKVKILNGIGEVEETYIL